MFRGSRSGEARQGPVSGRHTGVPAFTMRDGQAMTGDMIVRGVVAGVAGTVVMTTFQKLVEMPLTKRGDSYAPADLAEKVTPVRTRSPEGRRRLSWVIHFALGTMWGAAYGIAAGRGLRGQKAVNAVFGVVYVGDVALNTALGLYRPLQWSAKTCSSMSWTSTCRPRAPVRCSTASLTRPDRPSWRAGAHPAATAGAPAAEATDTQLVEAGPVESSFSCGTASSRRRPRRCPAACGCNA
jgi:hypothetical protein